MNVLLTESVIDLLLDEVRRAPSVHNVQSARWRFMPLESRVELWRDEARVLRVGDPILRDDGVGLGAAFEGLSLACQRRGVFLGPFEAAPLVVTSESGNIPDFTFIGSAQIGPHAALEASWDGSIISPARDTDLLPQVFRRFVWRGAYAPVKDGDVNQLALKFATWPDALGSILVTEPNAIARLNVLHDRVAMRAFRDPAYFRELRSWLRLSPDEPGWATDGLNAVSMGLNAFERTAARVVMRPRVFAALERLGIGSAIMAEAPKARNISAVYLFSPRSGESPFDLGRRLYRTWLRFTGEGYSLWPMSALTDDDENRHRLEKEFNIGIGTIFRVGRPPSVAGVRLTPRLAPEDIRR